ncbi:MAG TPA: mechanosensitive ion channel family protein [Bryobacteraceae bacterium]|jgi:small-conductance mechanosensitive channel/CRP-like cAMP-binding protein|nr:mechanosensitive ion channel family protein [Bryobacteraceae bacterium]
MRYSEARLLAIPTLLLAIFFFVEYHQTRWYAFFSQEAHYALQTLTWLAGAWVLMRMIRVFFWQRRPKHLSGPAPMLMRHTVNILILAIATAGIAKTIFNQPLTGFWATSSVVGIVLGIALRGIIADFFSGIAIELDPPFRIGDYVELRMGGDPVIGQVTEVNWRATQIVPRDSTNTVFVPNSLLSSIAVNNVYRPLGMTRFELFLWFEPGIAHDRVVRILMSSARATAGIEHDNPPLEVVASKYTPSGVEYIVRYFVPQALSPTGARDRLMTSIMDQAIKAGLDISFPHQDVAYERKPKPVSDRLEIKIGFLERNSFFRSCRPEELKSIAAHMHTRQYPSGARVVNYGEAGDSMYLVSEGLMEVSVPNGTEHSTSPLRSGAVVGKLLAGDFFGEMSLLTDEPFSATVSSVTDTVVYQIRRQHIRELMQNRPEILDGMTHVAAERRLRNENAALALESDAPSEEHQNLKTLILAKIHSLFSLLHD